MRKITLTIMAVIVGMAGLPNDVRAEPMSVDEIRERVDDGYRASLDLYREFLSLPNDATYPDDILKLVDWMELQSAHIVGICDPGTGECDTY